MRRLSLTVAERSRLGTVYDESVPQEANLLAAARNARNNRWADDWAVASPAGVTASGLDEILRQLPTRGPCAQLVRDAEAAMEKIRTPRRNLWVPETSRRRVVRTPRHWHRYAPPPTKRAAAVARAPAAPYDRNPECPIWAPCMLRVGAGISYRDVRLDSVSHPDCPPLLVARAAADPDEKMRCRSARHPRCPPGLLQQLAASDAWRVRLNVAQNPACPPLTLARLATDTDPAIRERVAAHPALPSESLAGLAADSDPTVRMSCLRRSGCPKEIAEKLAADPVRVVRQTVARHVPEAAHRNVAVRGVRSMRRLSERVLRAVERL